MGQVYTKLFPPPPSDAEIASIKQDRLNFYKDLQTFQTNISNQVKNNQISPDTSIELNAIVTSAQAWLRANPDATALQVTTEKDDLTEKAKPIYERETDKNRYIYTLFFLQSLEDEYNSSSKSKKDIDSVFKSSEIKNSIKLLKNEFKWIKSNPSETALTYSQRIDYVSNEIQKIYIDHPNLTETIKYYGSILKEHRQPYWWILKQKNAENNLRNQQISATEFDSKRLALNSIEFALQFFGSFLILTLIIFGGSLAANYAICREWHYRIFFFIFSLNPLLTPIILAYTALQALKGKPIEYYGLLPISTEPAKTRLGKILWWPFYYETDKNETNLTEAFLQSIVTVGEAVKSASKPPPFN